MAALRLRTDFDATGLRRLALESGDADQVRRLLAIAAIYDGMSRADAGRLAGMERQILRDWVERFNTGGPEALVNLAAPGNPRRLTPGQEAELAKIVEAGPASQGLAHLARWRCADLKVLIEQRWGVGYHERTIGKLLHRLGFSHITTRPKHYRQDELAMEAFKKTSRPRSARSAPRSLPAHP
jgi:transposase